MGRPEFLLVVSARCDALFDGACGVALDRWGQQGRLDFRFALVNFRGKGAPQVVDAPRRKNRLTPLPP